MMKRKKLYLVIALVLLMAVLAVTTASALSFQKLFPFELGFSDDAQHGPTYNKTTGTSGELQINGAGWLVNAGGTSVRYKIEPSASGSGKIRTANNLYYRNSWYGMAQGNYRPTVHKIDAGHIKGTLNIYF